MATACVVGVGIAVGVVLMGGKGPKDRMFRGKLESEWIRDLQYNDRAQVELWRGFGEEGVQVLVRGYQRAVVPGERRYRQVNRKLPRILRKVLPEPTADRNQKARECSIDLLSSLARDARSAVPTIIDAARNDETEAVRQGAIGFFITSAGDNTLANQLTPAEKKSLLPALLSAMENSANWGLRVNGALVLQYMGEHRERVAPVLSNALSDSVVAVRLHSADALNRVAPDVGKTAGATALLVELAKGADAQIASRAIAALKHGDPDLAVPALIECLRQSKDVACEAVWALEWAPETFDGHREAITAALTEAAKRKDSVGTYAAALRNRSDELARRGGGK